MIYKNTINLSRRFLPLVLFPPIFREDLAAPAFFFKSFEKIWPLRLFSSNLSRRFGRSDFFLQIFREDLAAPAFFLESFEKIWPLGLFSSNLSRRFRCAARLLNQFREIGHERFVCHHIFYRQVHAVAPIVFRVGRDIDAFGVRVG